jgi:hypothetical protein
MSFDEFAEKRPSELTKFNSELLDERRKRIEVLNKKKCSKEDKQMIILRRYNLILFAIHITLAIFLAVYLNRQRKKGTTLQGIDLDLFEHAFKINPDMTFAEVISERITRVKEGDVITLIVTFFAITAGFHLLYFLNPNDVYIKAVKRENNFLRWIEYSVSATIMIVIIALLSGVKNINNYILITVASIGVMSTGQLFETTEGKKSKKWLPILLGFLLLMGIFSVVFRSFKKRLQEAEKAGANIPKWLYGVVYIMFAFYASFGFVPIAQMIFKGSYIIYEYIYLTLSLVSKTTLGMLVAFGFSQRNTQLS